MRALAILTAGVLAVAGCGDAEAPRPTGANAPAARDARAQLALAARPAGSGEVFARGSASPAEHGPYALRGRYVARFEQTAPEDPALDFAGETAFVAELQRGQQRVRLFRRAARSGRAVVDVPSGRWRVVVEFGDYPYVIRLTPRTP
jgi:hypothetical protein